MACHSMSGRYAYREQAKDQEAASPYFNWSEDRNGEGLFSAAAGRRPDLQARGQTLSGASPKDVSEKRNPKLASKGRTRTTTS